MLAPRGGRARVLLAREAADRQAQKPSRLLFLGCDDATLARRAAALFRDAEQARPTPPRKLPQQWRLKLPLPDKLPPTAKLSVTSLRDYLACPFTFFLGKVLKMEAAGDGAREVDAMAFGNFCHEALENFAKISEGTPMRTAEKIGAFLQEETRRLFEARFGGGLSAVARLQMEEMCKRFEFFALEQERLFAEGWEIKASERDFEIEENGMRIRGRVDRVDYNAAADVWRILDYKTWDRDKSGGMVSSNKADIEDATVRGLPVFDWDDGNKTAPHVWVDMQLPLYFRAAESGKLADVIPTGA
ncbi:MAG: PD-(D/E)XK nuclease family protein, partial [Opitutaceae bacterium]|nr:PD-(D/E)XK nuclease family protein [Opitutaceae bacterium]